MSGGDYDPVSPLNLSHLIPLIQNFQDGLPGFGPTVALGLAKCGHGDTLLRAALGDQSKLAEFLVRWRLDVREELRSGSSGHLGKKYAGLSTRVSSTFPDVDVLNAYVFPLTSWSDGGKGPDMAPLIYRLPDVGGIAAYCERFAWGGVSGTLEKLQNNLWEGMCIRMLCKVR